MGANFGDAISGAFKAGFSAIQKRKDKKAAKQDREDQLNLIKSMDWEPTYASDTTPTYQQTQSPVARAYLESFLLGNNPDATFSGSPNARITKMGQQDAQNAMFGTPEQRVAQARAAQAATPWRVTAPTAPVVSQRAQNATFAAQYPELARIGIDSEDKYQRAISSGVLGSATGSKYTAETKPSEISPWDLAAFGGDNKNSGARRKYRNRLDAILNG